MSRYTNLIQQFRRSFLFKSALAISLVAVGVLMFFALNAGREPKVIRVGIPFGWSKEFDARHPLTVGDTWLADHTVMRWAHRRVGLPWEALLGQQRIDRTAGTLTITLSTPIAKSDGGAVSPREALEQLSRAIEATTHTKWTSKILENKVVSTSPHESILNFRFDSFPLGFEGKLCFGELGVLNPGYPQVSTGPYSIEKLTPELAILKRNTHFPKELTANTVEHVEIYSLAGEKLISQLLESPRSLDFATLPGFFVSQPTVKKIAANGFSVKKQSNDWILYAVIDFDVPYPVRKQIQRLLWEARSMIAETKQDVGELATSLTPTNYGGALNAEEFNKVTLEARAAPLDHSYPATIAIREQVDKAGLFVQWAEKLASAFPNSKLTQYPLSQAKELLHGKHSVRMSALGISSFDPVTHWQVLWNYLPAGSQAISKPALDKLVSSSGPKEIRTNARALETLMISEGLYMPMVFSPSLNFVSNDFEGDPKLEDEWGLQAWTYRWRGKK